MTINTGYIVTAIGILLAFGCNPSKKSFITFDVGPWNKDREISFHLDPMTGAIIVPEIRIEHRLDYKFENLYLLVTVLSNKDLLRSDTVSVQLASDSGYWSGKCSDKLCKVDYRFPYSFSSPREGPLEIKVKQFSRLDTLKGVENIGLRLIETTGN